MGKISEHTPSRRHLLCAGAGTVGAIAAAAVVAPVSHQAETPVAPEPKPAPDAKSGYQVTAHVLRYYDTARV